MTNSSALQSYLGHLASHPDPVLQRMEREAVATSFPIVGPEVGRVLHLMAKLIDARLVVELGSGFGYSAFWFATAVGPFGEVWLTDGSEERLEQAQQNLTEAGLWDRCVAFAGDALKTLETLREPADIIFMDIDKQDYAKALPLIDTKLRPGGLLIVDNMLWHGRVVSAHGGAPADDTTASVVELTAALFGSANWEPVLLPIRDGVVIARKRHENELD